MDLYLLLSKNRYYRNKWNTYDYQNIHNAVHDTVTITDTVCCYEFGKICYKLIALPHKLIAEFFRYFQMKKIGHNNEKIVSISLFPEITSFFFFIKDAWHKTTVKKALRLLSQILWRKENFIFCHRTSNG